MAKQRTLAVSGMSCTGCERRIKTALDGVSGVNEASADHEAGTVTLRLDVRAVDMDTVRGAIESLGYQVVV